MDRQSRRRQADGQDDEREQLQFVEPQEEVSCSATTGAGAEPRSRHAATNVTSAINATSADQRGYRGQSRRERHQPAITDLLSEGQEILVQIAKEPIAKKGARITSHIALPGRFLVYMPTVEHVGVSRKIESDTNAIACAS